MSSLSSAIKQAKKMLAEAEKLKSEHRNQLIVCNEYADKPNGALVVILHQD